IAAGALLATGLVRIYETLLVVRLPPFRWGWEPFALALVLGPCMALAATIVPAWQASRRSPLEALLAKKSEAGETPRPGRQWLLLLALVLVGLTMLFVLGVLRQWWGPFVSAQLLAPAMVCLLVGVVLILPLLTRPLGRLALVLLRPLLGLEGRLAARQLERQPTRPSLTIRVPFIRVLFPS